jgi:hypothetical protein
VPPREGCGPRGPDLAQSARAARREAARRTAPADLRRPAWNHRIPVHHHTDARLGEASFTRTGNRLGAAGQRTPLRAPPKLWRPERPVAAAEKGAQGGGHGRRRSGSPCRGRPRPHQSPLGRSRQRPLERHQHHRREEAHVATGRRPAATGDRTGFARQHPPAAAEEDLEEGRLGGADLGSARAAPGGATRGLLFNLIKSSKARGRLHPGLLIKLEVRTRT